MTAAIGESCLSGHAPLMVARLNEQQGPLRGWVVVDSLVDGRAMGGTRMTGSVTEDEVRALAGAMTMKLSIAGLRIGGAKAGIKAEPAAADRQQLLASFGRTAAPLLRGGIYLGTDQGITHADRDAFMTAADYDVRKLPGATQLPTSWATLWGDLTDITGFGVATAVLIALERGRAHTSRSVVIQGFGTVGRSVADNLASHGHRIVAVADAAGTVADPGGLPVRELIEVTSTAGVLDRTRLPSSAVILADPEAWLDVSADVLVLAAGGDAIRADNVRRVRSQLIAEGGNLCCTPQAKQALRAAGALILPDVVINVGAAAATGCLLTGTAPSGLTRRQLVDWIFGWVADRIRRNCHDVLDIAADQSADPVSELISARSQAALW